MLNSRNTISGTLIMKDKDKKEIKIGIRLAGDGEPPFEFIINNFGQLILQDKSEVI